MKLQMRKLFILSVTSGIIFFLLSLCSSDFILKTALVLLSLHLANIFHKLIWHSLPSQILPDITDKAVFITGCDTGFGNKLARQLDAKGLTVFAGCLFAEGPGASKLKEDCSKNLHVIQIDVTKDEQVSAAVKYVTNTLKDKTLHAIVNNAGVFSTSEGEFVEMEELNRVLQVNTVGVARVTKAFLPLLRKSKGRIVITVSLSGVDYHPFANAYTTSKHAVMGYANTIRRELMKWSISVHTIEPGLYNTEMNNKDLISSNAQHAFNRAPKDVREEYGEEYLKGLPKLYDTLMLSMSKRIEEVTECMTDAIVAKYPKFRYHPNFFAKFYFLGVSYLPQEVWDIIFHMIIQFHLRTLFNGSRRKTQ